MPDPIVVTMLAAMGTEPVNARKSYQYQTGNGHKFAAPAQGFFMKITLPEFTGKKFLMVNNRKPPEENFVTLGVLSDKPVFDGKYHAFQKWGVGGMVSMQVDGAKDSGRELYFGLKPVDKRTKPWLCENVLYWR